MDIFKSFKKAIVQGRINLTPVPKNAIKRSVLSKVIIEHRRSHMLIKLTLEDGTDLMFQKVGVLKAGDSLTLENIRVITDIIIS